MERPENGRRISLRLQSAAGQLSELVGYLLSWDEAGLRVLDRHGQVQHLAWDAVVSWRSVGVARGRDPRRTPLAELDRLAAAAGLTGRCFVARLSALLDPRPPGSLDWDGTPRPVLDGEWATTGSTSDLIEQAWWAARHDARSLQVRVTDEAAAAELSALGFSELVADRT